ncbi:hypothetical protein T484DRAFT_2843746 [Baffinella frigidus]|nr:hypothetical protein T484DRAFT_2843746 [Cryptophyta sp. CCMP2293]
MTLELSGNLGLELEPFNRLSGVLVHPYQPSSARSPSSERLSSSGIGTVQPTGIGAVQPNNALELEPFDRISGVLVGSWRLAHRSSERTSSLDRVWASSICVFFRTGRCACRSGSSNRRHSPMANHPRALGIVVIVVVVVVVVAVVALVVVIVVVIVVVVELIVVVVAVAVVVVV